MKMRGIRAAACAAAAGTLLLMAAACGGGGDVHEISGETFEHGQFQLTEVTGRPIIVNFWFPSCPPCAAELPDFQEAYEEYGDRVDFLGVFLPTVDTEEQARAFLKQEDIGVEYPNITASGTTILDYQVTSFPSTLFINAERTEIMRRRVGGPIPSDELRMLLDALLEAG